MRYIGKSISVVDKPLEELYLCDVQDAAITDSSISISGRHNWLLTGKSSDGQLYHGGYEFNDGEEIPGRCELRKYKAKSGEIILSGTWRDEYSSGRWIIELIPQS